MRASASSSDCPVGKFEGVEQVIARIVGNTYIIDAARSVTTGAIDGGEKPAVPAAILKMHLTELVARGGNDAMDVHGGKGVMLGPRNYLARGWQGAPIGITVEGANILTRNLIIFGQGAIRCHPFVLKEMEAARGPDGERSVDDFDRALFGHIGFTISNAVRSLVMALTFARFESAPGSGAIRRYYQHIERFSASFAFATDVAMLSLGGYLKKKESLSARLGDVLSSSCIWPRWCSSITTTMARRREDQPLVEWACRDLLYRAQEQLHGFLRNFPNRWLAGLMRVLIFPRGRTYFAPSDALGAQLAQLAMEPGATRDRLCRHAFRTSMSRAIRSATCTRRCRWRCASSPSTASLRVEGVKTGRDQGAGRARADRRKARRSASSTKRKPLCYSTMIARIMHIINVDDFAAAELPAGRRCSTKRSNDHVQEADCRDGHDHRCWLRDCQGAGTCASCRQSAGSRRQRPRRSAFTRSVIAHGREALHREPGQRRNGDEPGHRRVRPRRHGHRTRRRAVREHRPSSPADRYRPAGRSGHAAAG